MRELLQIDTPDWQLVLYGPDVAGKQRALAKTMTSRGKAAPLGVVVFDRLLHVASFTAEQTSAQLNAEVGALISAKALLFENTDYMFELVFKHCSDSEPQPQITHKLAAIQNSFRTRKLGNQLLVSGTLNFGNNIGWFSLPFSYSSNGLLQNIAVKFVVLPTKMDLDSDLQAIYLRLDSDYPLWRFAFGNSTESTADAKRQSNHNFPLLWLARFTSLRNKFEKNIRILLNAPHSRLVQVERRVKADRLKGKLSIALQEKLGQDFSGQNYHNSYATKRKILSLDTPENRFIKMVLQYAHFQLGRFISLVAEANKKPDAQIFSASFSGQLNGWQKTLEKYLHHPMFKEIGSFKGMSKESLVLQQKTGYSGVYQTWHELKRYLDVMGSQSSVSMKTIDELYEVWCFLEIRRILIDDLDFNEVEQKPLRVGHSGTEIKFDDVLADSYLFTREDGLTIRLAHEPKFGEKTEPVRSWLYDHKPDIVLEATFADEFRLMWLFDAKYRIDNKSDDVEQDLVPADAIYQMHRYRDALVHIETSGEQTHKSRSVYGAYALYPGANDQTESPAGSRYSEAIDAIGIGAFPLLPSANGDNGCLWLKAFLQKQFAKDPALTKAESVDRYLMEDSARIPHHGMQQVFYPDLTLVITAAPQAGRDTAYIDSFKNGTARYYHTRLEATERENLEQNVINEVRYCVIATEDANQPGRIAHYVWPVKKVKLVKRSGLDRQQTGLELPQGDSRNQKSYWLFEFGPAFKLDTPISGFDPGHHQLCLTTRQKLATVSQFKEIESVYSEVMPNYRYHG
ncbi:hypothetical protein Rhein_0110 [Rheinheimera sp. A13L]|uniref:DUF2357 domain-containing protein n=1 Tax=Rheinheimera sp. A13L TaxID=506534 RepID=UPI00021247F6|nr:DUF2357 domain-containing protein [Rheinheimera sp. A13L]EGM79650.1 hypothetical protein Rhein_0110 [Rheinheimera sp. A13L]